MQMVLNVLLQTQFLWVILNMGQEPLDGGDGCMCRTCGCSSYPSDPSFTANGAGSGPATLSSVLSKRGEIHPSPHPKTRSCFYNTKLWDFTYYLFVLHLFFFFCYNSQSRSVQLKGLCQSSRSDRQVIGSEGKLNCWCPFNFISSIAALKRKPDGLLFFFFFNLIPSV